MAVVVAAIVANIVGQSRGRRWVVLNRLLQVTVIMAIFYVTSHLLRSIKHRIVVILVPWLVIQWLLELGI